MTNIEYNLLDSTIDYSFGRVQCDNCKSQSQKFINN